MPDLDAVTSSQAGGSARVADRPACTRSFLLGATVGVAIGVVGLCVPFAAAATGSLMRGLEAPLPRPTAIVLALNPWVLPLCALVVAALLIVKERYVGVRASIATNGVFLFLTILVSVASLGSLLMPILSIGESLSPG